MVSINDLLCVCAPASSPFARALDGARPEPRDLDVEMLRGPNHGKGGKKVLPKPFADWASRWSKRGAGHAPASVETDGGGAAATAAARAAVAELLRAAASELPLGRIGTSRLVTPRTTTTTTNDDERRDTSSRAARWRQSRALARAAAAPRAHAHE